VSKKGNNQQEWKKTKENMEKYSQKLKKNHKKENENLEVEFIRVSLRVL